MVPQAHGGALLAGGIPGHPGARVQQRRRERSEAIKDAATGHIERLSEIMGSISRARLCPLEPAVRRRRAFP